MSTYKVLQTRSTPHQSQKDRKKHNILATVYKCIRIPIGISVFVRTYVRKTKTKQATTLHGAWWVILNSQDLFNVGLLTLHERLRKSVLQKAEQEFQPLQMSVSLSKQIK